MQAVGEKKMSEIWKDIAGYEGLYQISNQGRVKSLKRWDVNKKAFVDDESILHPTGNGYGYMIVGLRKETRKTNHYVHRLVADAFVSNPNGHTYVNHLDYNKQNNDASNLEWCSQKENMQHSRDRMKHPKMITHSNTGERYITKSGNRYRVTINKKEYRSCRNLEDAIKKRDEILSRGEVMPCLSQL